MGLQSEVKPALVSLIACMGSNEGAAISCLLHVNQYSIRHSDDLWLQVNAYD
jgi:hypothetical protein